MGWSPNQEIEVPHTPAQFSLDLELRFTAGHTCHGAFISQNASGDVSSRYLLQQQHQAAETWLPLSLGGTWQKQDFCVLFPACLFLALLSIGVLVCWHHS